MAAPDEHKMRKEQGSDAGRRSDLDWPFRRHATNPILTAADLPYAANTVFNAGVTLLPSGETVLLMRVEDRRGLSHLTVARSSDGIGEWRVDSAPTLPADADQHPEELWGIEDPRITWVEDQQRYFITYTAYLARRPARLPRHHNGLRQLHTARPGDAARRQGRRVIPGAVRRTLRHAAPAISHLPGRSRHLAVFLHGHGALGRSPGRPSLAPGRLVGRQQDRSLAPSATH